MTSHPDLDGRVEHRTIETNGIELHVALAGPDDGELVVLQHGWPECWFSWRHQLLGLADAGYRVAAPDGRGYGTSAKPAEIERYTVLDVVGDLVGLVGALDRTECTLVGHDWGALVTWPAALLRPDLFTAVCGMSVPYGPGFRFGQIELPPTEVLAAVSGDQFHYMLFFQQLDAHEDLDAHREDILRNLYTDPGVTTAISGTSATLLSETLGAPPDTTPAWLPEDELAVFLDSFERSGFEGGINWYRNLDRSYRLLSAWRDVPIPVPATFIAGALDGVVAATQSDIDRHPETCADYRGTHLVDGCGHWVQQEAPDEVNRLLLEFLAGT
ncbi:MAG: alpha/beta hydrolase [Actinomycetota bacterium]